MRVTGGTHRSIRRVVSPTARSAPTRYLGALDTHAAGPAISCRTHPTDSAVGGVQLSVTGRAAGRIIGMVGGSRWDQAGHQPSIGHDIVDDREWRRCVRAWMEKQATAGTGPSTRRTGAGRCRCSPPTSWATAVGLTSKRRGRATRRSTPQGLTGVQGYEPAPYCLFCPVSPLDWLGRNDAPRR